ncbi:MAG: Ig-like domain-containing protein, partial [Tannerella sp.]|nr:Ig-like domain-containing protein [Tannerella sp.]
MKTIYLFFLAAICCQLSYSQPEHLYLIGGPVNTHYPNWLLEDAIQMERDAENASLFRYKGYLVYNTIGQEGGNIKFLTGQAWDPAYHPDGTENTALSQALKTPLKMRSGGADTKWTIAQNGSENGYYEISIDTQNETICVDSFLYSPVAYPAKIFITGNAVPCGWESGTPETMTPVDKQYGVYSWSGTVSQGEFKFLKVKGSWEYCYVATTESESIVFGQAHPIAYEENYSSVGGNDYKFVIPEAGKCTIIADLRAMTVTVNQGIAISSVEDIDTYMRSDLNGSYYLTNDIEIPDNAEWIPIGAVGATDTDPQHFKGTFDGRGYSIRNLKISTQSPFKGLFARLNHATVKNFNLANVNIDGLAPTGGVTGAMFGETVIEKVSVTGNIKSNTEAGGIAGRVSIDETYTGYNIIRDCYVTAEVKATSLSTDMNNPSCAGGIVALSRGLLNDCYGKIDIRRVYVTGKVLSEQTQHGAGNAAGILAFYDNHSFVKMEEVIVLSDSIGAATPNLFFSRRGPVYSDFELFDKVYARTGIILNYLNSNDKGRGGEIPDNIILYNPAETYKTKQFYNDNLTWDFENTWAITGGEYPVLKNPVTSVALDETETTLVVGVTQQLTATVLPDNATDKTVSWSSSHPDVATVSETGLVTAVGAGTATITATTQDGEYTATCEVTVPAVPVASVALDITEAALEVGVTQQLTATVLPDNATDKTVSWSSSHPDVATVSETGLVT